MRPAGHVGQVERSRTGPPHPVRTQRELLVEVNVRAGVALAAGKPVASSDSASSAMRETRIGLPFSQRALPALGRKELVAHGIVDDAGHQRSVFVRLQVPPAAAPGPSKRRTAEIRGRSWWSRPADRRTSETRRPAARACPLRRRCRAREKPRPAASRISFSTVRSATVTRSTSPLYSVSTPSSEELAQPRARFARNLSGLGNKPDRALCSVRRSGSQAHLAAARSVRQLVARRRAAARTSLMVRIWCL